MDSGLNNLKIFGRFKIDTEKKLFWCDERLASLSPKAVELLCVLIEHRGEVLSKHALIEAVWEDSYVEESNLTQHIYEIRKFFKKTGSDASLIQTVSRRGYRFLGEVSEVVDRDEIIVERVKTTQTTVEEIQPLKLGTKATSYSISGKIRLWAPILIGLILVSTVLSLYLYNRVPGRRKNIKAIAVLPFKNIGGEKAGEHQGLAIADVLITRLSALRGVNVRPIGSVAEYESKEVDYADLGRKLKVEAILEGTVYRITDKVRISARLIDVTDQSAIWTGSFEQLGNEEMKLQSEIAIRAADSLVSDLSQREQDSLSKSYTNSSDAYDLYLKGRYYWNKRDDRSMAQSEHFFLSAIEKDPKFALAYIGLADKILLNGSTTDAERYLNQAIQIDPIVAEAYASRGFLEMFHHWDWDKAEDDLKRSIELNPGYGTAHQWYATLLMIRGRHVEAIAELRRALEIDPNSHNYYSDLGDAYYFARDFEKAEQMCLKALEISPGFPFAQHRLAHTYIQTKEFGKATLSNFSFTDNVLDPEEKARVVRSIEANGERTFWTAYLSDTQSYFKKERNSGANKFIQLARIFDKLGERQKALDNLERALEGRAFLLPFIHVDPIFDDMRGEPRFQEILKKMRLVGS